MMPAAQRSITHYTGLDICIEAAAKNPKIVPSVVSPTGVQLSVVSTVNGDNNDNDHEHPGHHFVPRHGLTATS